MTQAQKDAIVTDVKRQQEDFVRSSGAHPDDASVFGSVGFQGLFDGLRKAVSVLTLLAASGLTLYFGLKFYQATRRR